MNNEEDKETFNSNKDAMTEIVDECETLDLSSIVPNNEELKTNELNQSSGLFNSSLVIQNPTDNTKPMVTDNTIVTPNNNVILPSSPQTITESNTLTENAVVNPNNREVVSNTNIVLPTAITPTVINSNSSTNSTTISSNNQELLDTNNTLSSDDLLKENINAQIDNLRNMAKPIKENVKNKVISMKTQIIYAGIGVVLIIVVAVVISSIVNNDPKLVCIRSTGSKFELKFDETGIKSAKLNDKEVSEDDIASYQTIFSKDFLDAKRNKEDYVEEFKKIVWEYEKSNGSTCE